MNVTDLTTPALLVDRNALEHNISVMAARLPGARLRPHVKAHKCTALARMQRDLGGHRSFTAATIREIVGLTAAGLGDDLLLANEVLDASRLSPLVEAGHRITVAIDSPATLEAAVRAGVREAVIDVNVGLPRCGCTPEDAGYLAERARAAGIDVRGVMGYEGHLMMVLDPVEQRAKVERAMERLLDAHARVGGELVSAGGTGTHQVNTWATEIQAGSYVLMDSAYGAHDHGFRQALTILGSVVHVNAAKGFAVADVGLKANGMDHGNPTIPGHRTWFLSDEHITFSPEDDSGTALPTVGDRIRCVPAHCDPTVAYHEAMWLVDGDVVVDRWEVDLRGW